MPNSCVALGIWLARVANTNPYRWRRMLQGLKGVCEQTTSGVNRLRKLHRNGRLLMPAVNVNDSVTKSKFDNLYGCRESLIDSLKRATAVMIAGKTAVVAGYGNVGKGCAFTLRLYGAHVMVTEIDPICALQAALDGHSVVTMEEAVAVADLFVNTTGCVSVITAAHMKQMKDAAIVCNMAHYRTEIEVEQLKTMSGVKRERVKPFVDNYTFEDGHSVCVLADGFSTNLSCGVGNPTFIMSCSFCNQILAAVDLYGKHYEPALHRLPKHVEEEVARLHLDALNVHLTHLTPVQETFLGIAADGPFKSDDYRY